MATEKQTTEILYRGYTIRVQPNGDYWTALVLDQHNEAVKGCFDKDREHVILKAKNKILSIGK